jgi:hypothetical protein
VIKYKRKSKNKPKTILRSQKRKWEFPITLDNEKNVSEIMRTIRPLLKEKVDKSDGKNKTS